MSDYPSIPEPREDIKSLLATVNALKETIEVLTGVRGNVTAANITYGQMLMWGKISLDQIPARSPRR